MGSVLIVGGAFDRRDVLNSTVKYPPEAVLASALRRIGWDVSTAGHRSFTASDLPAVVHVGHMGRAALLMAVAEGSSRFVYTSHHDPRLLDPRRFRESGFSWVRLAASRFVIRRADAIVTLSRTEYDYMLRLFPDVRGRIHRIYNGVPGDVFTTLGGGKLDGDALRLLFVGKLTPEKGVDVLLHALHDLMQEFRINLTLVYQGGDPDGRYQRLVESLGLKDEVSFVGAIPSDQLPEWYRASHLLVVPSLAEGLPSVVSEAMMCGVPVVASSVGGIVEQAAGAGVFVEPGDSRTFAQGVRDAVRTFGLDGENREAISSLGRSRFGVEAMSQSHAAVYDGLILDQRPPRRHGWVLRPSNRSARALIRVFGSRLVGRGLLER